MDITLYYTHKTRSFRPRWLLEELELPYSLQLVDLFGGERQQPAYRKIHPHGSVPAIAFDGQVMIESCAMCHWLTDQHPHKQLAPAPDTAQRRDYEQWSFYVPGTLEPLPFQILLHTKILPDNERVPAIVPWAMRGYEKVLAVLDQELQTRDYIAGQAFSTADILLGSTLMLLPDMLDGHRALQDYTARLQTRPAFVRASKDPSPPA